MFARPAENFSKSHINDCPRDRTPVIHDNAHRSRADGRYGRNESSNQDQPRRKACTATSVCLRTYARLRPLDASLTCEEVIRPLHI